MASNPGEIGFFAGAVLEESARRHPGKLAIASREGELAYAGLAERVRALAGHLAREGIHPGARVGLLLPNSIAFALAYFATQRAGAVTVILDARLKGKELAAVLKNADLSLLVTHRRLLPDIAETLREGKPAALWLVEGAGPESFEGRLSGAAAPAARKEPGDDALILYTSGTTGEPKGVVLSHQNLAQFPRSMTELCRTGAEEVLGCILPMSHISGPIVCNEIVDKAGTLVIFDQFNPVTLLEGIQKYHITVFHAVPTLFQMILGVAGLKEYDTRSVRIAAMMGTTVPLALMRAFKAAHPHISVIQGYGLTETSPLITLTEPERADEKLASIGRAVPGVEVRIVDEAGNDAPEGEAGEIITRGPHVMKGYFRRPEATAERIRDGWLYTGDVGRRDGDGYYHHLGRKDDLIITGGMNVYPAEVENMLCEHAAILEAVVFAVSDPKRGQVIGAAVVPRPGAELDEKSLLAFLRSNLASFKVPQSIKIRDSLPRTSTGKPVRDAAILLA